MDTIHLGIKTKILLGFILLVTVFLLWTTFVVGWDFAPYYYDIPRQLQRALNVYRYGNPYPELV